MLVVGDKIKLIKKMGPFNNIGEVCPVVNISEDLVIGFRFGTNGEHLGCMSYKEFEQYFEKVATPKWTDWKPCSSVTNQPSDNLFKTNGKKVIVKPHIDFDNLRGESECMETDTFDLELGINIAEARLEIKQYEKYIKDTKKELYRLTA